MPRVVVGDDPGHGPNKPEQCNVINFQHKARAIPKMFWIVQSCLRFLPECTQTFIQGFEIIVLQKARTNQTCLGHAQGRVQGCSGHADAYDHGFICFRRQTVLMYHIFFFLYNNFVVN